MTYHINICTVHIFYSHRQPQDFTNFSYSNVHLFKFSCSPYNKLVVVISQIRNWIEIRFWMAQVISSMVSVLKNFSPFFLRMASYILKQERTSCLMMCPGDSKCSQRKNNMLFNIISMQCNIYFAR